MTPEQHKRIEELFDRLIQLPAAERDAELARQCQDDGEAHREVARLLASADAETASTGGMPAVLKNIYGPAELLRDAAGADPLLGSTVGSYSVLEKLNEGGFGAVYKAEQRRPVRRIVALKVIKLGFDTKEVIARFNSERQALARMDHPHISKVLDAGSTDVGRPYFVMEYVAGRAITQFCDENRLSIRERLLLFLQVCDAVGHAHQKAIIHRDIKAGNVLAFMHDGKPQAKVIDFGIAKALTSDGLTEMTLNTGQGAAIGTYESMSPEQATGSPDIDTRTDVYSLGVLLYHLLVGVPPFDRRLLDRPTDESLRRMIREDEPLSPSARLATLGDAAPRVAELRGCDVETLRRQLRRELEWIPLKAMRKERERRYPSAHSLAEDIENYLHDRALTAGPESRVYRFKKSLRRNARVVGAAAAIFFVLVLGIVATTIQTIRARAAQQTARSSELRALALADEKRQLAAEKTAALDVANHQLGVAFLENARRLSAGGDHFTAAMAAAVAVGFDGDHSGPPALRTDPLLHRNTPAWREALGLSAVRGDVRLLWRSPAAVHHGGPVRCVAFSPDGKTIASSSDDETLRLWDLHTGKLLQTFDEHAGSIVSVCFSPDGKSLAAGNGSSGQTVRIWDLATGNVRSLTGHASEVRSVRYSPAGDMIASASRDGEVRIWKAGSGQLIRSFKGNNGEPNSIAFSRDGNVLASSTAKGAMELWDLVFPDDKPKWTLNGSRSVARGVSFSPDGKLLASASQDGAVSFWDLTNPLTAPRSLPGHAAPVTSVDFSPDGKTLVSGSLDGTVRLWDVATGKPLETAAPDAGEVYSVAFSGDGKRLAWGSRDCRVHLWEFGAERPLQRADPAGEVVTSVTFSPDGNTIASASRDNTICLWDAATGERRQVLRADAGHMSAQARAIVRVVFSPDGKALASIDSSTRAVTLWDLATAKPSRVLEGSPSSGPEAAIAFSPDGTMLAIGAEGNAVRIWDLPAQNARPPLTGLPSPVTSVAFSPDGKRLAAGSSDNEGTIRIWELATGKSHGPYKGHSRDVTSLRFSPGGATLASGSMDKTVRLWDLASGKARSLQGHTLLVNDVSFSADGRTIASSSTDGTVRLWDVATGRLSQILRGSSERVGAVSFSPDGRRLASGAWDGTVSVWAMTSDIPRRAPLKGHDNYVCAVRYSPDGATLASGSYDRTVRLWDVKTGTPRPPLVAHTNQVFCVAFNPGGDILASGSQDCTVRLWDVGSGKPIGQPLTGARGAIVSLAFSPDGKTVTAGSRDHAIHQWNVATGESASPLAGHPDGVYSLAYSPDGKLIASGSRDPTIRLWNTATRESRSLPVVHADRVAGLSFTPDGSALASASYDGTVCLWDVGTQQPRWHERTVAARNSRNWNTCLSFSRDGSTLATGGYDGVISIWDAATGRRIESVPTADAAVFGVSFSPDGKTVACASNDTTIHLIDVRPNVPLRQYLAIYRFEGMDLVPLPAMNLYGDGGFRTQTREPLVRPSR